MEPLDARTQARVQATALAYRARFVQKPISTPAPQIRPPRVKHEGEAPVPRRILDRIVAAVSGAWGCDPEALLTQTKPWHIVGPRFAVYKLFKESCHLTGVALGDYLGRDRGTVREGIVRAEEMYRTDID